MKIRLMQVRSKEFLFLWNLDYHYSLKSKLNCSHVLHSPCKRWRRRRIQQWASFRICPSNRSVFYISHVSGATGLRLEMNCILDKLGNMTVCPHTQSYHSNYNCDLQLSWLLTAGNNSYNKFNFCFSFKDKRSFAVGALYSFYKATATHIKVENNELK